MPRDGQYTRPISDEERARIEKYKDALVPLLPCTCGDPTVPPCPQHYTVRPRSEEATDDPDPDDTGRWIGVPSAE